MCVTTINKRQHTHMWTWPEATWKRWIYSESKVWVPFSFKNFQMIVTAWTCGQWLYILNDINSLGLHVSTFRLIQPERQTHLLSDRPGFKSFFCYLPAEVSSSCLPLQVGNSDTPFNSGLSQQDISCKDSSFLCKH